VNEIPAWHISRTWSQFIIDPRSSPDGNGIASAKEL